MSTNNQGGAGRYALHPPAQKDKQGRESDPLANLGKRRDSSVPGPQNFDIRSTFTDIPVMVESSADGQQVLIKPEKKRPRDDEDTTKVDKKRPSFPVEQDDTGSSIVDVMEMIRYADTREDLVLIETEGDEREPTLVGCVPKDPQGDAIFQIIPDFSNGNTLENMKRQLGECHFQNDRIVFVQSGSESLKTRFIARIIAQREFPALAALVRKIAISKKDSCERELESCIEPVRAEKLEAGARKFKDLAERASGEMRFFLLKTHNNTFILSPIALDFVQDSSTGLAGSAKLDDQAIIYWPKKNDTCQVVKWNPMYIIRVTGAALKAIQMSASDSARMLSLVAGAQGTTAKEKDSLVPPETGAMIDTEWFVEKLSKCTKDPDCCEYFDPKAFAENISLVVVFDDQFMRPFYEITVAYGKESFDYRMYVNPKPRGDLSGNPSFFYGNELCILVKTD